MIRILYTCIVFLVLAVIGNSTFFAAQRREVESFIEFDRTADTSQVEEVRSLIDAFKESWAMQDVEGHIELFAENAEWINAYARMFRGTDEFAEFLRDSLFPNFDSRVSQEEVLNAKLISIRYLGDNAAVVHMYTDGSRGDSAIPGELLRRTHIHLVFAQLKGQWKIVHTAIMDARV